MGGVAARPRCARGWQRGVRAGVVPNELLVKFRPGTPARVQAGVHHATGAAVRGELAALDVEVVTLPAGTDPQQAASVYAHDPNVLYAEPNYLSVANSTPNDPSFAQQWGLSKIQAPLAWNVTQGREDISIAIVDSGIDLSHEDLGAKIVASQNFSTSDTDDDNYGHGTHLAGIAAAITDNGLGIAGLGSRCTLINAKVDEDNGAARSSAVAQGIAWAANSWAKVICMAVSALPPPARPWRRRSTMPGTGARAGGLGGEREQQRPELPGFLRSLHLRSGDRSQ